MLKCILTLAAVFYCDHHEPTLPIGHRFPMSKYRLLRERLTPTGLFTLEAAPLASAQTIELAQLRSAPLEDER